MPSLLLHLVVQFLDPACPDHLLKQELVRCPGCANTTFIRPRPVRLTYDVICARCKGIYSLNELVYKF